MARFDIYKNPGRNQSAIPFLLDVQSNAVSGLATRIVIPLRSLSALGAMATNLPKDLCPLIEVDGADCFLATAELGSVPSNVLKHKVGSVQDRQFEIQAALDRIFGAY